MERVLLNSVNFVHSVKTLILPAKPQRVIKATLLRQNLQNEQNGILGLIRIKNPATGFSGTSPKNAEAQGQIFFSLMAGETVWRFFVTGSLQEAHQAGSAPYQA